MFQTELTLPEEIMVLVLNERDGSLLEETDFPYAIGGAALAELIRRGRVDLEPGSVHPLVTVIDPTPTGDPVLDDVLDQLHGAPRRTTVKRWVGRLADDSELRLRVARQLCRKGALDEHEGRVRLIFRRTVYADVEPEVEQEITGRVRAAVFGEGPIDASTAVLTGLANASGVLSHVLDPAELLANHERLGSLLDQAGNGRAPAGDNGSAPAASGDGEAGEANDGEAGETDDGEAGEADEPTPVTGDDGSDGRETPRDRFLGTAPSLVAATRTAVLQGAAPAA